MMMLNFNWETLLTLGTKALSQEGIAAIALLLFGYLGLRLHLASRTIERAKFQEQSQKDNVVYGDFLKKLAQDQKEVDDAKATYDSDGRSVPDDEPEGPAN